MAHDQRKRIMTTIRDDRIALFAKLQDPASQPQFWDRVADDVDWTVEGTHPLAGRYHNKAQFIEQTFPRVARQAVPGGVKLEAHTSTSTVTRRSPSFTPPQRALRSPRR